MHRGAQVSKGRSSRSRPAGPTQSPRRTPRQERARETVHSILGAAALVFAAEGQAKATTNRIAERAGVSIGSLYQYFSSKEAILDRLLDDHRGEMKPLIQQAMRDLEDPSISLEDALRRFLTEALEVHQRNPALMQILADHAVKTRPPTDTQPGDAPYLDRVEAALASRTHRRGRRSRATAEIFLFVAEALTRWLAHRGLERKGDRRWFNESYIQECVHLLTAFIHTPRS